MTLLLLNNSIFFLRPFLLKRQPVFTTVSLDFPGCVEFRYQWPRLSPPPPGPWRPNLRLTHSVSSINLALMFEKEKDGSCLVVVISRAAGGTCYR
jgi:hypothetical protein